MNLRRMSAGGSEQSRPGRLLLLLSLLLSPETILACQFNVRDVGFVDLEIDPYHLYAFVRSETPTEIVSLLQQMPAAALRDCNVQFEIVDASSPTNHPAFRHPASEEAAALSSAVLVSPEGRELPLTLSRPGQPFRESLASVLAEVASSPKREELLATVSRSFAAVLLIEGEAAEANERARQAVSRAIEAIRGQMQSLPKAIAKPPAMVVLEVAALVRERVLLWSLGLDAAGSSQPRAAIIYGRARWIGPLMKGDEISESNLTGLLSIIGADCECGLDVAWTLGTRLPARWDEVRHAQVAKALGFDPESPLVRIEVGRIVARSGSPRTPPAPDPAVVLSSDPTPMAGNPPADRGREPGPASAPRGKAGPETVALVDTAPILSRAWVFVAAMTILVVSGGLFLLRNAGRPR
jgi:hypothetical protein